MTLAELRGLDKNAAWVWLALSSEGGTVVCTSRKRLVDATGIKDPKAISAAVTALERGGWIRRQHTTTHAAGQFKTLMRFKLCYEGAKSPLHTKKPMRGRNHPHYVGAKSPPRLLRSKRGAPGSTLGASPGAPTTTATNDHGGPVVHAGSLPR